MTRLTDDPARPIITLDLNPLPSDPRSQGAPAIHRLDPRRAELLKHIIAEYEVDRVYHLAALLSTRSELSPALAHKVNVEGTLNILEFAPEGG